MFSNLFQFLKPKKNNVFDLFETIKLFNHLIHLKDKIYTNEGGKKFILTRYGFYPVEQYNLNLKNEELEKENIDLKSKLNVLENKIENINTAYDNIVIKNNKLKILFKSLYYKRDEKLKFIKILKEKNANLVNKLKFITPIDNSLELTNQLINLKKLNNKLNEDNQKLKEHLEQYNLYNLIDKNENIAEHRKEKLLEKVQKMTENLENLKKKSHNQKEQITNLNILLEKYKNGTIQIKKNID